MLCPRVPYWGCLSASDSIIPLLTYKLQRGRSPKKSEKNVPDNRNFFGVYKVRIIFSQKIVIFDMKRILLSVATYILINTMNGQSGTCPMCKFGTR